MKRPPLAPVNISGVQGVINKRLADEVASHASTIHQLSEGHNVACGTVTLTVNVATTTVSADGIPATAVPIISAASANAATEIGNGTIYVSAVAKGSFTITHANAATTARTFSWWCPVPG